MTLAILLIAAFALVAVEWLIEITPTCPDCGHMIEEHGLNCMHAGCRCQWSQSELRLMELNKQ